LSFNQLTGNLDVYNRFDCYIQYLYVNNNQLNETITDGSFAYCDYLNEINLGINKMNGSFPKHFYNYKFVNIDNNHLNGPIPNVSDDLSFPLKYLSLANNDLIGTIPASISYLDQLLYFDVSDNRLSGSLDVVFNTITPYNIESLILFNNPFEMGTIPSFVNMTNLRELSLADTYRNGMIPTWFGTLKNLTFLDLHNNKLNGKIPMELGYLSNLNVVFINNNSLTGSVPTSFNTFLNHDFTFFLNHNDLTGSLEAVCGNDIHIDMTTKKIIADCLEPAAEMNCTCCTVCCNDSIEKCKSK
jgi:Leucine-rich repeat (LRR) protein